MLATAVSGYFLSIHRIVVPAAITCCSRLVGAMALSVSGLVAFIDNPQLGVIHWSAVLMAAMLLITGAHACADR